MSKLKISIVTPSYNQGVYIEETIKSVIEQNYSNLEYIIFDGGSTDSTCDIIKKYDGFITYWESKKDKGQSDAISKGLSISKGEIFAWQNSDDRYLPGTLDYVAEIFKNNPHIDILFGGWNYINAKGEKIFTVIPKRFNVTKLRSGYKIPPQPAVFFRRSSIERVGGLNLLKQQVMDYDLYIKIINKDNMFVTNRILGDFRVHSTSKTISGKKEQMKELKETRNEILKNQSGLHIRIYWFYSDVIETLKDYLHAKLKIFSIRDLLRRNT